MHKIIIMGFFIPFVIIGCTRSNAGADVSAPPVVTIGTSIMTLEKSIQFPDETPRSRAVSTTVGTEAIKTVFDKTSTKAPAQKTPALKTDPAKPSPVQGTPPPTPTTKVPRGVPVEVWKDIPIMPEAVTGDAGEDRYRFMLTATVDQVRDFYKKELPKLGWKYDAQGVGENGAPIFIFSKPGKVLSISVIVLGEIVIVTLAPI
jgi:hypothetical protein